MQPPKKALLLIGCGVPAAATVPRQGYCRGMRYAPVVGSARLLCADHSFPSLHVHLAAVGQRLTHDVEGKGWHWQP